MSDEYITIALWIIAGGATLLASLLGSVLAYHWIRFAMNTYITTVAIVVNVFVSLSLILTLCVTAATYHV